MQAPLRYLIKNNYFWLSVERCVYWENENTLVLSDLHFGKTGHFRKSGIAVPQNVYKEDLQRLLHQVQFFGARKLIVVGDLFHSSANKEHDLFKRWRNDINDTKVHLVKGNHDLLNEKMYSDLDIQVHKLGLQLGQFNFIHDIATNPPSPELHWTKTAAGVAEQVDSNIQTSGFGTYRDSHQSRSSNLQPNSNYSISGHIHPGIRIGGIAKQALRFPCFYFAEQFAVLPAFSRFTGLALIQPKQNENVFAIVENKLLQIQ
jgi:uncharacterized protein